MGRPLRLLVDTHVIYWILYSPDVIRRAAKTAIQKSETTYVSLVSFWEVAIKVRAGKMKASSMLDGGPESLGRFGFQSLSIDYLHVHKTLELPLHHRDPFDRLLIAQAKVEGLTIISNDAVFDRYGVDRVW